MEPFQERHAAPGPSLFILQTWTDAAADLTAGITGRSGGVSSAPWSSLNCGLHVGDRQEDVIRNRECITEALGWPFDAWTSGEQVHGDAVYRVELEDRGRGRADRDSAIPDTDAVMTNVPGILLTSFYADCVPLFFHDPEHGAVALAHAGWKGTVLEIARKTVEAMSAAYGTAPSRLRGAIGPSIGSCCYEVDEPVIARVEPLVQELCGASGADSSTMIESGSHGRAMLNLKEINRQIMIKAGILPTNIELTTRCTGCRRDAFFSHRLEQGRTGRMASFIGMKSR
jgi:polyphenol oxidase